MSSEHDHGENTNSTNAILDLLKEGKEGDITDDLLPPDSPVKKERQAKKFFEEICYIIMIESVRIHENLIAFIREEQEEIERNEAEQTADIKALQAEQTILLQLITPHQLATMTLTEEQLLWLHKLETKFDQLLSYLDFKIDELTQAITIQQQKVDALRNDVDHSRRHVSEKWLHHFQSHTQHPHFQPLRINISLLKKFKKMSLDKHYKDYIEFGHDIYLHIGQKIRDELHNGHIDFHEIKNSLRKKIEQHIENYLNESLSFIPPDKRESMIKELLQDHTIQNLVIDEMMSNLSNNEEFMQALNHGYKINKDLIEEETKLKTQKECLVNAKSLKSIVNRQRDEFKKLGDISSHVESNAPPSELKQRIDMRLDKLDQLSDHLLDQSQTIFNSLDDTLSQLKTAQLDMDNMLNKLTDFLQSDAKQESTQKDITELRKESEKLLSHHANTSDHPSPSDTKSFNSQEPTQEQRTELSFKK